MLAHDKRVLRRSLEAKTANHEPLELVAGQIHAARHQLKRLATPADNYEPVIKTFAVIFPITTV
jgi:hypothetical protein